MEDEVKTFASLAEESSKINESFRQSFNEAARNPAIIFRHISGRFVQPGVHCSFTIAHFLMESADGAKYYHDLDVDHARWGNPHLFRNQHRTPESDNWRRSQKDLPGARSRLDQIHS
jgi:hypothetical protein